MLYEAEFPDHRTGTIGPTACFSPIVSPENYDVMLNSIQGWGEWAHPVEGGNPRTISVNVVYSSANFAAARALQLSALGLVGTVGTLTLEYTGQDPEVYPNACLPKNGVGEQILFRDGNLILPLNFIQAGAINQ